MSTLLDDTDTTNTPADRLRTTMAAVRVSLSWFGTRKCHSYCVIALDPNPAASSFDTTHPHVQDGSLREGEGSVPIRQALRQGRLLDFFIMVRQILQTYNPSSAFVILDKRHR